MPYDIHEDKIMEFQELGYSAYGFMSLYKAAIIDKGLSVDLQSLCFSVSKLKKENQATMTIRRATPKPSRDDCFSIDFYHCETAEELFSFLREYMRVIPDCFRFDNKSMTLEVIEVKYENSLNHRRLAKYAYLDDILYQITGNKIRMKLYEVCARSGMKIEHDLNRIFNMFEFSYCDYGWGYIKSESMCKSIGLEYKLF